MTQNSGPAAAGQSGGSPFFCQALTTPAISRGRTGDRSLQSTGSSGIMKKNPSSDWQKNSFQQSLVGQVREGA
jgi:hypothetical protein